MKHLLLLLACLIAVTPASAGASQSNVGIAVPTLRLTYLKNQADTLNKPMILEFWATWCPPCRKSIPHLNEVYAKYKERGLVVIGVTEENREAVEPFLQKVPMNYTVALDPDGSLGAAFGIRSIPHALLVDSNKKVVWEGHPMELKDSAIEALLK